MSTPSADEVDSERHAGRLPSRATTGSPSTVYSTSPLCRSVLTATIDVIVCVTSLLADVVAPVDAPVEALGRVRPPPVGAAPVGATGVEDGVVEVVAHVVVGGSVVVGDVTGTSVVGVEVVTAVSTVALGVVSATTTAVGG